MEPYHNLSVLNGHAASRCYNCACTERIIIIPQESQMKRSNNDDPSAAKRLKVMDGFLKMENTAEEAFANDQYEKVMETCKIILAIHPDHTLAHFWAGIATQHVKDDVSIGAYHLTKYFEGEDKDPARLGNAFSRYGFYLARMKRYQEAQTALAKCLELAGQCNVHDELNSIKNMAVIYSYQGDKDRKIEYYHKLVDRCLEIGWYDSPRFNFWKSFDCVFSNCYPEESKKLKGILEDTDAFKYLLEGAYEKWSDLTVTHQKYVEIHRSSDYKQLQAFSQLMKTFMLSLDLGFTDETVEVIHQHLFNF